MILVDNAAYSFCF